jgi:LAO/AO transport system kinase
VEEVWAEVGRHRALLEEKLDGASLLDERRRARLEEELRRLVARRLEQQAADLWAGVGVADAREALAARRLDPYRAADQLLDALRRQPRGDAG